MLLSHLLMFQIAAAVFWGMTMFAMLIYVARQLDRIPATGSAGGWMLGMLVIIGMMVMPFLIAIE